MAGTRERSNKTVGGFRAGLASVVAMAIVHFVILRQLGVHGPQTTLILEYVAIGLAAIGLGAALYAVFGVCRHRNPAGFLMGWFRSR